MKAFTVIDAATAIPAIAFRVAEAVGLHGGPGRAAERILERGGFGRAPIDPRYVVLCTMDGDLEARLDPFRWGNATKLAAHLWLIDHFDELVHGQDLDVETLRLGLAQPTTITNPIRAESRGV